MAKLMFGIISDIDVDNGLARVFFDEDDFPSAPLKISCMRSSPDQVTFPFDVKEHVWCIMDDMLEYGVIGGAIFDENNKPQGSGAGVLKILFGDNSAIKYDRNSHILSLEIQGKVTVNCNEADLTASGKVVVECEEADVTCVTSLKITAPDTNITGALNVSGVVALGGLASITPGTPIDGSGADLNVKTVAASGDITAEGKSLATHVHTAPSGGGITSAPI